jgi:HSP20 family protein
LEVWELGVGSWRCAILCSMPWQALVPPELGDLTDDVRRIFRELDRRGPTAVAGQCTPALDVWETDEAVEVLMDLPGVSVDAVRVVLKGQVVLIAGEKAPDSEGRTAGDFHLVERGFGRFARGIRVAAAFDGSRARASIAAGELRIVLPKIHDRRGRPQTIAVSAGDRARQ